VKFLGFYHFLSLAHAHAHSLSLFSHVFSQNPQWPNTQVEIPTSVFDTAGVNRKISTSWVQWHAARPLTPPESAAIAGGSSEMTIFFPSWYLRHPTSDRDDFSPYGLSAVRRRKPIHFHSSMMAGAPPSVVAGIASAAAVVPLSPGRRGCHRPHQTTQKPTPSRSRPAATVIVAVWPENGAVAVVRGGRRWFRRSNCWIIVILVSQHSEGSG